MNHKNYNLNTQRLNFYIDDSGTDNFSSELTGFVLCAAIIGDSEIEQVEGALVSFRQKWSQELEFEIKYLRDSDIEQGMKGIGPYSRLSSDKDKKDRFISELSTLLTELPYKLLALGWYQIKYTDYLGKVISDYYQARHEQIKNIDYMQDALYPLLLVAISREIFTLFSRPLYTSYNKFIIWPEYKSEYVDRDEVLEAFMDGLSKRHPIELRNSIKKTDPEYPAGLEIADLCANTLRHRLFDTGKYEAQYEVIKGKVILCKNMTEYDYQLLLGKSLGNTKI